MGEVETRRFIDAAAVAARAVEEPVLTSPSGRYVVLQEDVTVTDPRLRYVAYGPVLRSRANRIVDALRAGLEGPVGDSIAFHVIPWAGDRDIR